MERSELLMTAKEVAEILGISTMKVKSGILNGTMPIGTVVNEGKNDRIVVIRKRFDMWMNGEL